MHLILSVSFKLCLENEKKSISASVMATFDINGYINNMNSAGESAVPFGQFESSSNEEYKNLMANYLDKNVSFWDN